MEGIDREAVVERFQASLAARPDIDAEGAEFMLARFREAIENAPLEPELQGPDRNTWIETLELLVQGGVLAEDERERLIRQFGEATSLLEDREVRVALEFARRFRDEGDTKALAWLTSQENGAERRAPAAGVQVPGADPIFKQEITRSRSRRLRGPPGSA